MATLEDFLLPSDQFGLFRIAENLITLVIGTDTIVAVEDPSRIFVCFHVPATGPIYISTNTMTAVNQGIEIPNSEAPVSFSNRDSGPLAAVAWHAFSGIPGPVITVLEVFVREPSVVTFLRDQNAKTLGAKSIHRERRDNLNSPAWPQPETLGARFIRRINESLLARLRRGSGP